MILSEENSFSIVRFSKIVAVQKRWFRHYALMDGGHEIRISANAAARLTLIVSDANHSDESFFSRGG